MKGSVISILLAAIIVAFLVWVVFEYSLPSGASSDEDIRIEKVGGVNRVLDKALAQDPNNEQIQNLVESIRNPKSN